MPEVTARLRIAPGRFDASKILLAEELEQLKVQLTEALRANVPVSSRPKPGQAHIRDTIRGFLDPPVAGFWRLKFKADYRIRFLVKGAKPHDIRPSHATAGGAPELRLTVGGGFVFAGVVHHPGMHKSPFITKAIDEVLPGAVSRLRGKMGEVIASELRASVPPSA